MSDNFIEIEELGELERGDIVKHKMSKKTYVVDGNYGSSVTAVSTIDIGNPKEWLKLKK